MILFGSLSIFSKMPSPISSRIQEVIQLRRSYLPRIEARLQSARRVEQGLGELDQALDRLMQHPNVTEVLKAHIRDFRVQRFYPEIVAAIQELEVVRHRLLRDTINIGVSGQARVGKSTLLQTISGLAEEQIPTGSGIPVTAVRSRLRHSVSHERATLTMHTFESFREKVLAPYHQYIQLASVPATLAEFRNFDYTDHPPREVDTPLQPSQNGLLVRLRGMQRSLPSYEHELTGGTRIVGLEGLRSWVAYPTQAEENDPNCPRHYLAVQDVLIECRFPENDVENLMVTDLPGLGELDAKAEERHVEGLKHEVDLVLLVKRPVEGNAFWKAEDAKAADLLDKVRGAISQRRDFVFIVINIGETDPVLTDALIEDIRRKANEGVDGLHYYVICCDAKDSASVRDQLLMRCLEHLAHHLQDMDQDLIEAATVGWRSTAERIQQDLTELRQRLKQNAPAITGSEDRLYREVETLRRNLSVALSKVVLKLHRQARTQEEDPQLIEIIEQISESVKTWINEEGLGIGSEAWIERAYSRMIEDKNVGGLAIDELNRVRVYISEAYTKLDDYFEQLVEDLWSDLSQEIRAHTGHLLEGVPDGKLALERFSECLENANEPCEEMLWAVSELLKLKISYRSHFHPRVRERIDFLNQELVDPRSGNIIYQVSAEVSQKGAAQALKRISDLATQASYEIQKALKGESVIPSKALHAAAEQFEDSLIRSEESKWEFAKLARSYRDEIWPGMFQSIDADNAKMVSVRRSITDLEQWLDQSKGELQ